MEATRKRSPNPRACPEAPNPTLWSQGREICPRNHVAHRPLLLGGKTQLSLNTWRWAGTKGDSCLDRILIFTGGGGLRAEAFPGTALSWGSGNPLQAPCHIQDSFRERTDGRGSVVTAYSSRSFPEARLVAGGVVFRRLGLPPPRASPSPRATRARTWMQK